MGNYAITNRDNAGGEVNVTTTANTYKSMTQISSQATGRAQIYDVLVGALDVPNTTDCPIVYDFSRSTTTTTGVTTAATALNPADPASRALCRVNFTTEPTITATTVVLNLALNQRASQRWVAAPGSELIIPNTSVNGITGRAFSTNYASKAEIQMMFTDL